jgi:hypothetical protein
MAAHINLLGYDDLSIVVNALDREHAYALAELLQKRFSKP